MKTGTSDNAGNYDFSVHMLAGMDGKIRVVKVPEANVSPDNDALLEQIFYFGQNDVQPVEGRYSVSVGDVVELDPGYYFVVRAMGFAEMTPAELTEYRAIDRDDRTWSEFVRPRK